MKGWVAYERDETGWPTDACLVVTAETQAQASQAMAAAIAVRAGVERSRVVRARIWEIFIEAPAELPVGDVRAPLVPGRPVFRGF